MAQTKWQGALTLVTNSKEIAQNRITDSLMVLKEIQTKPDDLFIDFCHSLEWPIFRHTIDPKFVCLSVCVFVCLSDLTHQKVKGF